MPKTLLLADDSVVIQKLVGLSFANEDVKLITTDNGDDALTRAREIAPDLILADVVMPGKNGYEVCEAIKADAALSHTPVLLLTGTFEAFDEERARQVGSDGHITKPFEAQGLVDRVTDLLARQQPSPAAAAAPAPAPPADDTYDFFDDDVSELAEPMQAGAPSDGDSAFEFGSSEFEPLAGAGDDDPLAGESFDSTLDTGFDLETDTSTPTVAPRASGGSAPRDELTMAVSPEQMARAMTSEEPPALEPAPYTAAPTAAPTAAQAAGPAAPRAAQPAALDATVIAEDFGTPPPVPTAETTLESDPMLADDLFAGAPEPVPAGPPAHESLERPPIPTEVPVTSGADRASIATGPAADDGLDFGFESSSPNATTVMPAGTFGSEPAPTPPPARDAGPPPVEVPRPAPERDAGPAPDVGFTAGPAVAKRTAEPTMLMDAPVIPRPAETMIVAPELPEPATEAPAPEAAPDKTDWDVSSSDLGQPMARPAEPVEATANAAPAPASPDLSPMMRDRIHETLEKVAWEAFADLSDTIVRQVLERVESTVWEIVPQMAETLIQEEIRRMKGETE